MWAEVIGALVWLEDVTAVYGGREPNAPPLCPEDQVFPASRDFSSSFQSKPGAAGAREWMTR
jgi:hypothetical protein